MRFQRFLCSLWARQTRNRIRNNSKVVLLFVASFEPLANYPTKETQQKEKKEKAPEIRRSLMVVITYLRAESRDELPDSQGDFPFSPVNNTGFSP